MEYKNPLKPTGLRGFTFNDFVHDFKVVGHGVSVFDHFYKCLSPSVRHFFGMAVDSGDLGGAESRVE